MQSEIDKNLYQCRLSDKEILKYVNGTLMYSSDGGYSWDAIPWKPSLKIRIFAAMGNFSWPPAIKCFGWRNGKIAIAWRSTFEAEVHIGKFVGTFDRVSEKWSVEALGTFNLSDDVLDTWFESAGFDVFVVVNRFKKMHRTSISKSNET